jgi:hypothetical protein
MTIQIKRGAKANLPATAPDGQPLFCEDTKELFVGTGTGVAQVNAADAKSINGVPITGTPDLGKIPIGQGNGTAVFADPFCQGVQAEGTVASTLNPILISGKGADGNQHDISVDNTGKLNIANFPATQPVSGSVSVSNLPATQTIAGSVSVTNFPATQSISGTVSLSANTGVELVDSAGTNKASISVAGAVKVDGSAVIQPVSGSVSVSNFPATQPISAASLPLPTGAATAAKQPALGTAGTPSTDVITVQGAASMTALKVDGSATTQPVSGTVTSNQGTPATAANAWPAKITDGTNTVTVASLTNSKALAVEIVDGTGTQITSFGGGTQFADGATSATPTGTVALGKNPTNIVHALALDALGNLNVNVQAGGTGGNASVSTAGAAVPTSATMAGGSDGTNLRALKVSTTGVLSVDGSAVTQPVSGTVTANAGTGNFNVVGTASDNSTDSTAKLPTIPARANAAVPAWTEGNQVPLSTTLAGELRSTTPDRVVTFSFTAAQATQQTATTAVSSAQIAMEGRSAVSFNLTGSWVGTVVMEGSVDGSAGNWIDIDFYDEANEKWVLGNVGVTANGSWFAEQLGAFNVIRLRCSAFTSGTITGTLLASTASMSGTPEWTSGIGSVLPPTVGLVGGSDGTNLRPLKVSATGVVSVDGSAVTQPSKLVPQTSGGLSTQSSTTGATATSIKTSAGQLFGWYIGNSNTSAVYVQLFDALTGSVTLGTTSPKLSLMIPAGGAANVFSDTGIAFATGISFACTTTRSGSTGPTSTIDVNFMFA